MTAQIYPSIGQVLEILSRGDFKRIPIKLEICSDMLTPVMAIQKLKKVSKHCFLLESAEADKTWGRYTFLGFDPSLEISCKDHVITLKGDKKDTCKTDDPGSVIRKVLSENRAPLVEGMPTFTGGLVGYFSYDYIKYSEPKLRLEAEDTEDFKDVDLMLFDKVIAFDHYRQKVVLIANIKTDALEDNYWQGISELKKIKKLLTCGEPAENPPLKLQSPFRSLFDKDQYCHMVEKAKHHIKEGDIFQIVLSNRMEADMEGSLLDTYRYLRMTNPSPYMFYFASEDIEMAGASPETLVKQEQGVLHTFPLAGTRRRGATDQEDALLEKELLEDEKELSEHNMLVDLGRNDIGRISKLGSVEVERYMDVLKYSHVMHIGSTVRGVIREDLDALNAIDSILPAGTLSGAPKLRACQLICELENCKRGVYGGAIGYIDFTGNMDTCIAIRLAFAKNGKVFVRSGAGIVEGSVPEKEYQECINKAQAVLGALRGAEGGLEA